MERSGMNISGFKVSYEKFKHDAFWPYVDSLYQRLAAGIADKNQAKELEFAYNMQMSYHYQSTEKILKYITRALEIKPTFRDAQQIMENYIRVKFYQVQDGYVLLDSLKAFESHYGSQVIKPVIAEFRSVALLKISCSLSERNKITDAEKYLVKFEENCVLPVQNAMIDVYARNAYRAVAVYYFNKSNKTKAKEFADRGKKYLTQGYIMSQEAFE